MYSFRKVILGYWKRELFCVVKSLILVKVIVFWNISGCLLNTVNPRRHYYKYYLQSGILLVYSAVYYWLAIVYLRQNVCGMQELEDKDNRHLFLPGTSPHVPSLSQSLSSSTKINKNIGI